MTITQRFKNWMRGLFIKDTPTEHIERVVPTMNSVDNAEPKHATPRPEDETEPWVNIGSTVYDPVKGFRIELDWNEAFIQHLRDSGVGGRSEEEVVQKWLGLLYGDLIQRLESTVVERNSDTNRVNDFL